MMVSISSFFFQCDKGKLLLQTEKKHYSDLHSEKMLVDGREEMVTTKLSF